jgi:hypothetical protein
VDDVDQVPQVPAQPVEFPYDQGVAVAQGFETGGQLWAIFLLSGGPVLIERVGGNAGGQERIALKVRGLGSVGHGDAL